MAWYGYLGPALVGELVFRRSMFYLSFWNIGFPFVFTCYGDFIGRG